MKRLAGLFLALGFLIAGLGSAYADKGQIVYIVDTMGDPFWGYVALGIKDAVQQRGYDLAISDSKSSAQNQLQNAQDAVAKHGAGIVLSPTELQHRAGGSGHRRFGQHPGVLRRHRHGLRQVCDLCHLG